MAFLLFNHLYRLLFMRFSLSLFLLITPLLTTQCYAFQLYGFIPWKLQHNKQMISDQEQIKTILASKGIQRIDVVYHNRMLTQGYVDKDKIKKIALNSQAHPDLPISFDYEIGTPSKPESVLPSLMAILDLYHAYGGKAPVGVYSLFPLNSYGGKNLDDKQKNKLITLNKQYEIIADKIDFISPVFYFYDDEDFEAWKKSVDFNLTQSLIIAKKYNLKIYPYITNSFRVSKIDPQTGTWVTKALSKKQMFTVLRYLKEKGADGAIIWTGSGVKDQRGEIPIIKFKDPWFKGVQKFIGGKVR